MASADRLLIAVGVALIVVGCADPRSDPSHLEPGNAIRVAQDALGSGSGGRTGFDDGATIGAVPRIDYPGAPNVPVMTDGQIDVLFFWDAESLDGEALRTSFFVNVKVAEQSFTRAHDQRLKSLFNDAEVGIPRQGVVPRSQRLHSAAKAPGAAGGDGPSLPLVRAGQSGTRVTVAQVDRGGQPRVVGSQVVAPEEAAALSTPEGIQRMVQRLQSPAGAPSAPPAGSSPSTPTGGASR